MLVGNMALPLMKETVWFDKPKYDEAERVHEERNAKKGKGDSATSKGSIAEEIAKTRERIQNSLKNVSLKGDSEEASVNQKVQKLELELDEIKSQVDDLHTLMKTALDTMQNIEQFLKSQGLTPATSATKSVCSSSSQNASAKAAVKDDDDIDLFGSDDEDEAATKLREERLKAYESKKSKKAPIVAKSSVVLDVKPWDDETDLKVMEAKVREIQTDGLKWGASKLVPLAYGIQKLQIVAVVEDEKVSVDWLQETIQDIEDLVQSVDVAAFNKL